ncbi:hypothetical protein S83_004664 [Arachis hypogaea]
MNYLNDGRFDGELGNGVSSGCCEVDFGDGSTSIEDAMKVLLQGLGEDINREGIRKTPFRVAKALREGTRGDLIGYKQKVKDIVQDVLFPEAGLDNKVGHARRAGGLVIVRDLDHFSYCESCLLPFQVKCHVSYVPSGQRVLGLSKFCRVAGIFVKWLQEPQRLADEICSVLHQQIQPAVFVDKKSNDWAYFLGLLRLRGTDMEKLKFSISSDSCWCPSLSIKVSSEIEPANPGMVAAAASIITSLGEDPLRKELAETPRRFVEWIRNVQSKPDLKAQCELHLLPFHAVVHIGYFISDGFNPIGRSHLQSIIHFYGFKLQVQERLTRQIAEAISPLLGGDVIVVAEASHMCMISREIEKFGSNTSTIAVLGRFATDVITRASFLKTIPSHASCRAIMLA